MSTVINEKELVEAATITESFHVESSKEIAQPIVLPPLGPIPEVATPHGRMRVLPRLLAMADTYYRGGSLHQAIELYFELVHDHDGTAQAQEAEQRLLDVARTFEESGELRQARGIYEQLL